MKTKVQDVWSHMKLRCKSDNKIRTSYNDCSVSKEWMSFEVYQEWYNNNYYEIEGQRMEVDKDWLIKGNKVYSAETCLFVPGEINLLIVHRKNQELPIGVQKRCSRYCASQSMKGTNVYLGTYDTAIEAFNVYKEHKEIYIKQIADEYKDRIPSTLYNAMYDYKIDIKD